MEDLEVRELQFLIKKAVVAHRAMNRRLRRYGVNMPPTTIDRLESLDNPVIAEATRRAKAYLREH